MKRMFTIKELNRRFSFYKTIGDNDRVEKRLDAIQSFIWFLEEYKVPKEYKDKKDDNTRQKKLQKARRL